MSSAAETRAVVADLLSALAQHGAVSHPMPVDDILHELESGAPIPLAFGITSGTALPQDLSARLRQLAEQCRPPEPVAPEVLADYKIAAERVERDLVATLGWEPSIEVAINGAGGYVSLPGRGFSLGWGKSLPQRIVRMGDALQGEVIEEQGVVWPRCPLRGHNHPLRAAQRDGLAVWECALSGQVVAEIGSLSEASAAAGK